MFIVSGWTDNRPRRSDGEEEATNPAQVLLPRGRPGPATGHVKVGHGSQVHAWNCSPSRFPVVGVSPVIRHYSAASASFVIFSRLSVVGLFSPLFFLLLFLVHSSDNPPISGVDFLFFCPFVFLCLLISRLSSCVLCLYIIVLKKSGIFYLPHFVVFRNWEKKPTLIILCKKMYRLTLLSPTFDVPGKYKVFQKCGYGNKLPNIKVSKK